MAGTKAVEAVQKEREELERNGRKRQSSERHHYNQETKAAIGKYAQLHGNKRAVSKFSESLGFTLSEATVRNFKREVRKQVKGGQDLDDISSIPTKKRGRPLLLPEDIDELARKCIENLRACGSPVSSSIVLAATKGIVAHKNCTLLKEHGGHVDLKKSWAFSFLSRNGYVKRKATRTSQKVCNDFENIKATYLKQIRDTVETNNIPTSMVVNFDQTGTKMVPVSCWTLEVQGSKQIDMVGLDDKRELTALLAVSLSGELLPPQVIYAGTTQRCHPNVPLPDGWHLAHSQSHWSTTETMLEYVDAVLAPYMMKQREHLGLAQDAVGLCIFDVFATHRCDAFLKKLEENHMKCIFVPAGCTGQLQPLDVSVNSVFKDNLKKLFTSWYADQVKQRLDNGETVTEIKVDLRMSAIKPVHFQWLKENIAWLSQQEEVLIRGWKDTGILEALGN